jgi:hypothetical protein
MRAWCLALMLGLVGCSSPSNTQFVPVGSRCGQDSDCGTAPFSCNLALPAGYCTRMCNVDSPDCPTDSKCVATTFGNQCRRACTDPSSCRVTPDGYSCKDDLDTNGTSTFVCDF